VLSNDRTRVRNGADLAEQVADPRDTELAMETKRALRALAGLKARQRRVLTLWTAGYTYTEIAELTGSTYTWVNRYMSDGRAALRRSRDAA